MPQHPTASSRSLRDVLRLGRPQQQEHAYQPTSQQDPGRYNLQSPSALKTKTGARRQTTLPPQTPASQQISVFRHAPKVADPDPAADRLDDDTTPLSKPQFYELVGMEPPDENGRMPKQVARPGGLFGQIRGRMRYIQVKYRVFDVFTYAFLAIQLLLSAIFIVLGSIRNNDYHTALVVLGAVSTVVTGSLALMKGQGLPNRLRQVRDDLRNVVFAVEELYWDVAADRPILFKDVKKVREDYMRVVQESRRNHPDSWTAAENGIAKGIPAPAPSGARSMKVT